GLRSPVCPDAELGVSKPFGNFVTAERFPRALKRALFDLNARRRFRFDRLRACGRNARCQGSECGSSGDLHFLAVHPRRKKPAIHANTLPGYKPRGIRSEEDRCADEFWNTTKAFHRSAHEEFAAALGSIKQRRVQICPEDAWRNCV